jgi:hypothetical protein
MNAYEWARDHKVSCDALKWLAEHPDWTTADAWRECHRGDWMFWALSLIEITPEVSNARDRVVLRIVTRAVETHALHCGVPKVEQWARRWISGEDRSAAAALEAEKAAEAAGCTEAEETAQAAAWAAETTDAEAAWVAEAAVLAAWAEADAEHVRQADDLRTEIPEWPGGNV